MLLALAVALFHSFGVFGPANTMTGGTVSVQAFYIISGFYMALILNEKYKAGPGSYRLFITSRFLRIYPAYWACLFIVLLVCLIGKLFFDQPFYLWYWTSQWDMLAVSSVVIFILSNLFLVGSDWLIFSTVNQQNGHLEWSALSFAQNPKTYQFLFIPQIWSVGLEITFYLLAPFLLRRSWRFQLIILLAGLLVRCYFVHYCGWNFDPWTYRFFPLEIVFFMAGSLAYKFYDWMKEKEISNWIPRVLWLLVMTAIVFYPNLNIAGNLFRTSAFYILLAVSLPFVFRLTKNNKADRFIGELSFPVYISHHLIMFIWRQYFWNHHGHMHWFGIATVISSLLFSLLLWFVLISPLEKYRQRRVEGKMKTINFTT